MSEVIKSVFVNFFVCAVLGGFLEYIAPNNAKKTLRVCVVSIMLVCAFSPLLKTEIQFPSEIDEEEISQSEEYSALYHTANLMEKKIYSQMREILINSGITEYEIYVKTTVSEDEKTVYLESIVIEVGSSFRDETEKIIKCIPEEYSKILKVGVKNE